MFPLIKLVYDDSLKLKDDLDFLLKNHYETSYNTDKQTFLSNLKIDNCPFNKGELIFNNFEKHFKKSLEIFYVDVIKNDFINENMNLQCIVTFFIDGASSIPIENNFWHYFLFFEKNEVIIMII